MPVSMNGEPPKNKVIIELCKKNTWPIQELIHDIFEETALLHFELIISWKNWQTVHLLTDYTVSVVQQELCGNCTGCLQIFSVLKFHNNNIMKVINVKSYTSKVLCLI